MARQTFLSRIDRAFKKHFPAIYYNLVERPKLRTRFKIERQLVQGVNLSKSSHKSIIFFTTQKCASRYVSGLLAMPL